jgi:hypothetical protein
MRTVPPGWRHANPWGPAANAARASGELAPLCPPTVRAKMAEWSAFGRDNIQDGDLIFRYGASYNPAEVFTSRLIAVISDGRFSHAGFAHWEGDVLYVYDTEPAPQGVRKIPFAFWALDTAGRSLVVKRLRPEYRRFIPAAFDYCEKVYQEQVPFDDWFKPDDTELYCTEMIEKAFLSGGLELSEPLPIRCLPHYLRYSPLAPFVEFFSPIRVDRPLFALGNEHYGVFGSPFLDLVWDQGGEKGQRPRKPPRCCRKEPPEPEGP